MQYRPRSPIFGGDTSPVSPAGFTPMPTSKPSGTLIHPTDRQQRQADHTIYGVLTLTNVPPHHTTTANVEQKIAS